MLSHLSVSHSVHGGGKMYAPLHAWIHPPRADTLPRADTTPPHIGYDRIRSKRGRYVSYRNGYLLRTENIHIVLSYDCHHYSLKIEWLVSKNDSIRFKQLFGKHET